MTTLPIRVGFSPMSSTGVANQSLQQLLLMRASSFHAARLVPRRSHGPLCVVRSSLPESEVAGEDVLYIFLKERQEEGDFISKVSDALWRRNSTALVETEDRAPIDENPLKVEEEVDDEDSGGYLKLTKTQLWISGGSVPPANKKLTAKERQNDSEKRKRLNFLRYEALKRELLLLTAGIGVSCSGYCLAALSVQAAISYAVGALFSCMYLQLLYYHADNLTKDAVPPIFLQKKIKRIGIRSEDLQDSFVRTVKGSAIALSSPRLVIPAAIYGLWALLHQFDSNFFDFQIVPAMFGLFAYKAAALVQVYRDNEDLRLIFPDNDEIPNGN